MMMMMMMMMTPTSGFAMVIGNSPYRVLTLLGRLRSFALSFVFALSLLGLGLCGSTGDELSHFFFRCHFQSKVFLHFRNIYAHGGWLATKSRKGRNNFAGFRRELCPTALPNACRLSMRLKLITYLIKLTKNNLVACLHQYVTRSSNERFTSWEELRLRSPG